MECVGLTAWGSAFRFGYIKVTAPNGKTMWEGLPMLPTGESFGVSLPRAIKRSRSCWGFAGVSLCLWLVACQPGGAVRGQGHHREFCKLKVSM